jgi:hypothetical protein
MPPTVIHRGRAHGGWLRYWDSRRGDDASGSSDEAASVVMSLATLTFRPYLAASTTLVSHHEGTQKRQP